MIARKLAAASCLVLALGCRRETEPVVPVTPSTPHAEIPKYTTDPEPDFDTDNLLNLAYGAAVVARTGQLSLEGSAIHAIDSSTRTGWSSPPSSREETIIYSLRAPAKVTRVGASTGDSAATAPTSVLFETSSDGVAFTKVHELATKAEMQPQLADIAPVTAQYVRVTVRSATESAAIRSFHAIGAEVRPPAPITLSGCFRVNVRPARFEQVGATITGVIATEPPILLDGGSDGRVARMMWTEGPMWGYAAISVTPDGHRLSGLKIHEEISTQQYGDGWFGESIPCDGVTIAPPQPATLAAKAPNARWSMFGVVFDAQDQLVVDASRPALDALARIMKASPSLRLRVVAHELRSATPEENRRHTETRIASMRTALASQGVDLTRIELVANGSEWSEPPIHTALQRLLASRVDLERFGR